MQGMMGQPDVASDPDKFQRLAKQTSSLEKTVTTYRSYKNCLSAIRDTQDLLKESSDDPEMSEMAEEELAELQCKQKVHSASPKSLLLTAPVTDDYLLASCHRHASHDCITYSG
jgi:peptide chain release factor 1